MYISSVTLEYIKNKVSVMPSFNPTAVSIQSSKTSSFGGQHMNGNGYHPYSNGGASNLGYMNNLLGSGNLGPDVMSRVFMSFRSGIELEIKWALTTVCLLSMNLPNLINLEKYPSLGNELIKYFIAPYQHSEGGAVGDSGPAVQDLNFSLDALLALRNASQDLINQQWLSQVKNLKKIILKVLKLLIGWIVDGKGVTSQVLNDINQYHESMNFLLDLLENLTCYYIDNNKNDPLVQVFIGLLGKTRDKSVVISSLKCLGNLLIIRSVKADDAADAAANAAAKEKPEADGGVSSVGPEAEPITTNCIDSIPISLLQKITEYLLVNDQELNFNVIRFIKQYLGSEALNPQFPTVTSLQQFRLRQLCSNKSIFSILVKQLPQLMLESIPLNDPSTQSKSQSQTKSPEFSQLVLSKRTLGSSVPTIVPELSDQLYDIIVKFHEPLRASTWLRCCYEPVYQTYPEDLEIQGAIPGEVTQISLWKAYEKQFEKVWQPQENGTLTPNNFPKLLPAVDFIKNVSAAFPHSQAMMQVIESDTVSGQPPKRKFVIKGIQPRQFVVNIDVGNYDALKQKPKALEMVLPDNNLPIGHIDQDRFLHNLSLLNSQVLLLQLDKQQLSIVNVLSLEIMGYIMSNIIEGDEEAKEIFRHENSWLRDYIYVNPGLVDSGILSTTWLEYLV